jgi:hypothetical protein
MASAVLGKVSPTPKGEYVSTQDYDRLDVVTYEGYPYLAKSNVPSGNLPTDELYWMPLLIGLDFAPGGYGLGMTAKEILDANAAVDNGWYKLTSVNAANAHVPFQYVAIYVTAYSDKYVIQDLYRTNGQNAHMRREMYNGTWGEWEYVNPPLMPNVEYRTIERVDGKAVYKKRDSNGVIMYRLDGSSTWTNGLPGAAPSGYGLGGYGDWTNISAVRDLDYMKYNGWFSMYSTVGALYLEGIAFNGIQLEVSFFNDNFGWQTVHFTNNFTIRRQYHSGTWTAWEWVNPPMTLGVEYRTTERWNGSPVYAKAVSCGKGPSGGAVNLPTGLSGNVTFVEANCKAVSDAGWGVFLNQYLSFGEKGSGTATLSISGAGDLSTRNIYLTVKYIKG